MFYQAKSDVPEEVYYLIGNGFDIEAGLPTRYTDYLNFLKAIDTNSYLSEADSQEINPIHSQILTSLQQSNPRDLEEQWKKVIRNFWFDHFSTVTLRTNNWVDFEDEISRIVQIVEYTMDHSKERKLSLEDKVIAKESDLPETLQKFLIECYGAYYPHENDSYRLAIYDLTYRELRDRLLGELKMFIDGFERYLREYVEKIKVDGTPRIEFLVKLLLKNKINHVLTFNYTTAFERYVRVIKANVDVCHIHGTIGINEARKSNIVLGMDEYLPDSEIKNHLAFASFRKYNQRIINATDTKYMDWISQAKENTSIRRLLIIFGHSIGITDGDIIRSFIELPEMKTIVYYYDEDALNTAVTNLSAILKPDELIRITGGEKHTLEFRKQDEMRPEMIQF